MIKRPIRVIINFLRTRSFPSVYEGHDKHTHRPQHAIDSFHFKKKTRQFKQNLSWCYILLHPLLPEKKVPIPAASNSSPSILSCSPPQNPTHHCSAPPVTLRWANPTVSSQSPPYRTCQRSSRQPATLSPLLELPASPGFPDPHAWFSFLSLVIPSQSQPLVSPHLPASPCWRGPGPRPQSLH